MSDKIVVNNGCTTYIASCGSVIAACLSGILNHSFWWCVLHFLLSWTYVIYALFFRFHDIITYFKGQM